MQSVPPRHLSITRKHTKGTCRWCGLDVTRLNPRRKTFCCDACVHEWKLRSDPTYLGMEIFKRDRGICSECGVNTVRLMLELLYHVSQAVAPAWALDPQGAFKRAEYIASRCYSAHNFLRKKERTSPLARQVEASYLENNGFKPAELITREMPRKRLWEADHILAVFEGGGQCGLDNYRTLCYWCHKQNTAEQAKIRAVARKKNRK